MGPKSNFPKKMVWRITQASLNQTAFHFSRNVANIIAAIDEAVERKSDLLCLEELTLTGYDCGDDFQKTDNAVISDLLLNLADYAHRKNPNLILSVGHPWRFSDKTAGLSEPIYDAARYGERHNDVLYNRLNLPFNVQSFLGARRVLAMTAKSYLFGYERGYESRYFAQWSSADANRNGGKMGTIFIRFNGQKDEVPFGRPILQVRTEQGQVNLAHLICEEKWVASCYNQPHGSDDEYHNDGVAPSIARYVGSEGLIFVVPNASPPAALKMGKHVHLAALASRYGEAVIDTDGLGSSGSTFAQFGYRLIAQHGKIVAYGRRLGFGRVVTTTSEIEVSPANEFSSFSAQTAVTHKLAVSAQGQQDPSLDPSQLQQGRARRRRPKALIRSLAYQEPGQRWDDPSNPDREAEETIRMAALWLFDYMRKTNCQGIVEALSGGADSGFNTTMVAVMVRLAVADLGVEGFCQEMRHLHYVDQVRQAYSQDGQEAAIQTCLRHMLTGVYMGTNNNSQETLTAARFLMQGGTFEGEAVHGIGGRFIERNVQDLLDFYATVYAVKNVGQLDPARKAALQRDLAAYLNQRADALSPQELQAQAQELRAQYPELAIDPICAADPRYGLAYENIQARARQVLVMLVANAEGKMAVANPNLDEARNAYATFGGDLHSGTVNLNGFLSKEKELGLLRHLCERGLEGLAPIKALSYVLRNKPSAQLQVKDAQGNVEQNDEDALQRNFAQMNRLSELILHERAGHYAERRLNPIEVYAACEKDWRFEGVDACRLYNMVRLSYHRWAVAQHKIHAAPIAPTFGRNVDHQTSLRTPNFSGPELSGLADLGVRLLFAMARQDFGAALPASWSGIVERDWRRRAVYDEAFGQAFDAALREGARPGMDFDLQGIYDRARQRGLAEVFRASPPAALAGFLRCPFQP